ncbi:MAG: carboxypeptidase regulatory-like domain-containing protein [Gemmatimonadaceae bacterium]|nr:carboxypeptidase regulatory-like domain-containing protein [Gemmatimonadaceae bacterium]
MSTRKRRSPAVLARLVVALVCAAPVALAQPTQNPGTPAGVSRATVSGGVRDSIAGRPLVGALVQLVGADSAQTFGQTVLSDSLGEFVFPNVPDGRYTLGFFHAILDSLGLEPVLRAVTVAGQRSARVDLATPSPTRLRAAICGLPSPQGPVAVAMGFVRDAQSLAPLSGVKVVAEWIELSIGREGVVRRSPRRVTTTKESGWFAICDVPSPGAMVLMASRGADSTDFIDVQVPADGFLRRELYLGAAQTVIAEAKPTDSLAVRRVNTGNGLLRGTVTAERSGQPLAGAQVSIVNGPQTRTNERGEWAMVNAPAGTRTLEVRAVGYYPERSAVDVIDSAPPLRVALATFKSVLDTMKVIANYDRFSNLAGFRERSRSGLGRFVTAADLVRRQVFATSDLFRNMPGVYLDGGSDLDQKIYMRGIFSDRCEPAVYLNGTLMTGLNASEIDAFARPSDILGIEVYSQSQAPAQFQPGLGDCGSIVFWTK